MPALAPRRLVAAALVRVGGDLGPRRHRVAEAGLRLPVHLDQHAAGVRVAHPGGRVGVPGERRAARAAARLVLRRVRPHRRVVGLLGLPGDDPVLDVDLPRARARAVHPVRGADDLVVAPAVPVEDVAVAAALRGTPPAGPAEVSRAGEEPAGAQQRVRRGRVRAALRVRYGTASVIALPPRACALPGPAAPSSDRRRRGGRERTVVPNRRVRRPTMLRARGPAAHVMTSAPVSSEHAGPAPTRTSAVHGHRQERETA